MPLALNSELKRLRVPDADQAQRRDPERARAHEHDRVHRRLVGGVQTAEPGGQHVVPPGDHRQARHRGEGHARLPDPHRQRHQNRHRHERRGDAERPVADAQHLRHRPDQVDVVVRHVGDDGARAEHEHQGDDRRRDEHRARDRSRGRPGLAGQDGHVLEAAQRAEAHLPEDVQVVERELGKVGAEGMVFGERAGEQADHAAAAPPRRRS